MSNIASQEPSALIRGERYVLVLVCALLLARLYPVLSTEMLAGWDLTPHYQILQVVREQLGVGKVFGYDPFTFGGMPTYPLYGPLLYLVVSALHIIVLGAVPLFLIFNLALFCLPFLFLFAVRWAAVQWWGNSVGVWSLVSAYLLLMSPRSYLHGALGITGLLDAGLVNSFAGLCVLALFCGLLAPVRLRSANAWIWLGCVLAILIPLHPLTASFAVLLILSCLGPLSPAIGLRALGLGAALSSWWWLPFVFHLPLGSADTMGLFPRIQDPLLVLFPDLNLPFFRRIASTSPDTWLQMLPLGSLVLLVGAIVGIAVALKAGQRRLALAFLILLLLLPRNLLQFVVEVPLHYYRFIAPLSVLMGILVAGGLSSLSRPGWRAIALHGLLLLTIIQSTLRDAALHHGSLTLGGTELSLSRYPAAAAADATVRYLSMHQPVGIVAVESSAQLFRELGTPHLFSTKLALTEGISVVPGLLAESALGTGFFMPALARLSNVIVWGRQDLLSSERFKGLSDAELVARLRHLGVSSVIAESRLLRDRLTQLGREAGRTHSRFDSGRFQIFELSAPPPRIVELEDAQLYFLHSDPQQFRYLGERLFEDAELYPRLVTWAPDVSQIDTVGGGAVIIGQGEQYEGPLPQLQLDKDFETTGDLSPTLRDFVRTHAPTEGSACPEHTVTRDRISFNCRGRAILRFSYSRQLHVRGEQVRWVTPTFVLVSGEGQRELRW